MAPVTHGRSSGSAALPSSALATPAPSWSGDRDDFVRCVQGTRPHEDGHLLARVEDLRRRGRRSSWLRHRYAARW